jgi:pantoate--beta-alanine ligase
MLIVETVAEMDSLMRSESAASVGFVPTMGALHEGHLSLVRKSQKENEKTVVSIFVNPTQFNDPTDFKNYPRDVKKDINLLSGEKVDYVFTPTAADIYPTKDNVEYQLGEISSTLEGAHRPGHFNGVASVVKKLFEIVRPKKAYFGLKDFQQFQVIRELNRKYNLGVDVIGCETKRDDDGLAMSSRNALLTKDQRDTALHLSKALKLMAHESKGKTPQELEQLGQSYLKKVTGIDLEYLKVVNPEDLKSPVQSSNHGERIALLAAKVGSVRLIDNMFV